MTDRLRRLRAIAELLRDQALQDLRKAAGARDESRALLAGLSSQPDPSGADPAEWRNALLHQIWADARRAEINLTLARQTAAWIEARASAARATGRAEVLRKLSG